MTANGVGGDLETVALVALIIRQPVDRRGKSNACLSLPFQQMAYPHDPCMSNAFLERGIYY